MAFENLTERERQILFNLITHYIQAADPVGSRVIANRFGMGLSSATIRNTLQDLEELGLVTQPHTSAGRIPTDLGYRVYVDFLLRPQELSSKEKSSIRQSILRQGRGVNEVLGQTCRILGEITSQLGVSIAPRFEEGVLKRVKLIPISDERVMVVVVVESGLARSLIIEIEASISESELKEMEPVLNERLAGLNLGEIRRTISERLGDLSGQGRLVKLVVDAKDRIWTDQPGKGILVSGAEHLVMQPEFANLDKVSDLIKLLEDGTVLSDFLSEAEGDGIVITIGSENKIGKIVNCSLVSKTYKVGKISGSIAVIGPTRMPYGKLVSVVDYTARTVTDVLTSDDISGENKE
ncbi:MAG: heat-inducible transcriptional repressor HrcA [Candidatus Zixiibacteriota bacterium]